MAMIKGVHHISMKCCTAEEFEKTLDFYGNILGLPVARRFPAGVMFDLGGSYLELFNNGTEHLSQGLWRHIALAVDDVDAWVKTVSEAGYAITVAPKDIVIQCDPPVPARIAFCIGPMGEEIEFFHEK